MTVNCARRDKPGSLAYRIAYGCASHVRIKAIECRDKHIWRGWLAPPCDGLASDAAIAEPVFDWAASFSGRCPGCEQELAARSLSHHLRTTRRQTDLGSARYRSVQERRPISPFPKSAEFPAVGSSSLKSPGRNINIALVTSTRNFFVTSPRTSAVHQIDLFANAVRTDSSLSLHCLFIVSSLWHFVARAETR
jgi:hypothetical protein